MAVLWGRAPRRPKFDTRVNFTGGKIAPRVGSHHSGPEVANARVLKAISVPHPASTIHHNPSTTAIPSLHRRSLQRLRRRRLSRSLRSAYHVLPTRQRSATTQTEHSQNTLETLIDARNQPPPPQATISREIGCAKHCRQQSSAP